MPGSKIVENRYLTWLLAAVCILGLRLCLRLTAAPNSRETILQQVEQFIQQGDLAKARNQLTKALKDFPEDSGLHNLMGVVEARQGNYSAAEVHFKKAIEGAPRSTGVYLNLGRLYQENVAKDPEASQKSLRIYQRLLSFDPTNVEANYQTAVLLERQGEFKPSLTYLSHLSAADQQRPQALAVRCADYAGLGEHAQAKAAASRLLASTELKELDILPILSTLEAHGANELESRLLEGLIERRLASPGTLHRLGLIYWKRGEWVRARATLEKVAEEQTVSAGLLVELAHIANQQGDHKGALGYLAHARDLEPQNAAIHFFFGMVCVEENLTQEAYASLKKAVALDPTNAYYNYALGAVAVERENARESIPYFQKYCELRPQDPRGRLALGSAYFYSHDVELARKELEAVLSYPETAAGAHYFLGRLDNQEGNFSGAAKELQQALEANPNNADGHAELGVVYLKRKRYKEAETAFLQALRLDPDNYHANLNLMILYQRTQDPRAAAQARRFEEVKNKRAEKAKEFLRTIEVRP